MRGINHLWRNRCINYANRLYFWSRSRRGKYTLIIFRKLLLDCCVNHTVCEIRMTDKCFVWDFIVIAGCCVWTGECSGRQAKETGLVPRKTNTWAVLRQVTLFIIIPVSIDVHTHTYNLVRICKVTVYIVSHDTGYERRIWRSLPLFKLSTQFVT